jgi:hypothetical protein
MRAMVAMSVCHVLQVREVFVLKASRRLCERAVSPIGLPGSD